MSFNPQNVSNSAFSADIKCFPSISHMCQYPICSQSSPTNTRYFTRFGKIYVPLSYRNSTPRSSSGNHNGAKIAICINKKKIESFKTPTTVWMGLPVSRVADAASLGIWLPTLREGISSYKEDLNSSRRDHHAPFKYRGASKRNLVTTYYNLVEITNKMQPCIRIYYSTAH